jgi:hypothetical protein
MSIKDLPHVTVEQVLALRKSAIELEQELSDLKASLEQKGKRPCHDGFCEFTAFNKHLQAMRKDNESLIGQIRGLKASLPKIKADAVRDAVKATESRTYTEDHFGMVGYHNEILSQDILTYANKLEDEE